MKHSEQRLPIESDIQALRESRDEAIRYVREKVDQLLCLMGTQPLRAEELDDSTLISLDPIGIIAHSFEQVLDHLRETNGNLTLARDELRATIDAVGAAILVVNRDYHVEDYNQRGRELLLEGGRSIIGEPLSEVLPNPGQAIEIGMLQRLLDRSASVEQGELTHGEQYYHVVATPMKDPQGDIQRVIFVYTDITSLRQAEESLQHSERKYRSLYNAMGEGVVLFRPAYGAGQELQDFVIVEVNPAFESLLKVNAETLRGRRLSEVFGQGRPYLDAFARVMESGEPTQIEYQLPATGRMLQISAFAPGHQQVAAIFEDITERKRAADQIQRLAYFDTLTGLPNRALMFDRLAKAVDMAKRQQRMVGVLFVDLDRFKPINDTLGHSAGDRVLKMVSERLCRSVRSSDTVARLGGDEFLVLLSSIDRTLDVIPVANNILERLHLPFQLEGRDVFCSASIGISVYPEDGTSPETLIQKADIAMYAAKEAGRNAYQFFSEELNRQAVERMDLETGLRRALMNDEFRLVFQPQLDTRRNRVMGAEALLRWDSPLHGQVSPAQFIPVAEDAGMIIPIGEWVMYHACEEAQRWRAAGWEDMHIAVNLSVAQFNQRDFTERVRMVLEETGLPPQNLELELTESILMDPAGERLEAVLELKSLGVQLAIDDFGTGYSSLNYLKQLPIDRVKIAQEFVRDIPSDRGDIGIVKAVIALADSMGLNVIAEGVETPRQVALLQELGCLEMQGYYYARPLSAVDFRAYLEDRNVVAEG